MSKFTIYTDKQHEFRWKFIANNDSVVARSSEGFKRQEDCLSSLGTLQKDIAGATVVHEAPGAQQPKVTTSSPLAPAPVVAGDVKAGAAIPATAASPAAPDSHN